MIPKILHFYPETQLEKVKLSLLRERYANIYSNYKIIEWNDNNFSKFINLFYPSYYFFYSQNTGNDYGKSLKICLTMLHNGGIYFDLDFVPFRNMSGMLSGKNTLLTSEYTATSLFYNHKKVISDLFLACDVQNLFIKALIDNLITNGRDKGKGGVKQFNFKVLINDTYDKIKNKSKIIVIRNRYLQHLTKNQISFSDESLMKRLKYNYAVRLLSEDNSVDETSSFIQFFLNKVNSYTFEELPLISCLCISNNSKDFLKNAIKSFNDQLYENKELIIICEKTSKAFNYISTIKQLNIFVFDETNEGNKKTLGELRNISVSKSNGQYVTQWDDDDIYDPHRILEQYIFMDDKNCQACILDQVTIFDKKKHKFSLSKNRNWEGSILFNKKLSVSNSIFYPELSKGEDSPFVENFASKFKIAKLSDVYLYLYVTHDNNTFSYAHHEQLVKTYLWIFKTYLSPKDQNLAYYRTFFYT